MNNNSINFYNTMRNNNQKKNIPIRIGTRIQFRLNPPLNWDTNKTDKLQSIFNFIKNKMLFIKSQRTRNTTQKILNG